MAKSNKKQIIHCSLVGDSMVGKTSLIKQFVQNEHRDYAATIFENFAGDVTVAGKDYTVNIFDTAGEQVYEGLRRFSYEESDVIVVCYSAVNRDSYNNVRDCWAPEIKHYVKKGTPIILVETDKNPKLDKDEAVTRQEGNTLAIDIGATLFADDSLDHFDGIEKLFERVVTKAIEKRKGCFLKLFKR